MFWCERLERFLPVIRGNRTRRPVALDQDCPLGSTSFDSQSEEGGYSLTIGPNISDLAANPMNQDGDGTNGETPDDQYTGTFAIVAESPFQDSYFDFGTATSWVESGYTRIDPGDAYGEPVGYGWTTGNLAGIDRGAPDALRADYVYTTDSHMTFVQDVPNGGTGCLDDPLIIQRTYRVEDPCGNMVEQTQSITVVDVEPPVFTTFPGDGTFDCLPAPDPGELTADDNCGGRVEITHVSDSDNGGGAGLPQKVCQDERISRDHYGPGYAVTHDRDDRVDRLCDGCAM